MLSKEYLLSLAKEAGIDATDKNHNSDKLLVDIDGTPLTNDFTDDDSNSVKTIDTSFNSDTLYHNFNTSFYSQDEHYNSNLELNVSVDDFLTPFYTNSYNPVDKNKKSIMTDDNSVNYDRVNKNKIDGEAA